MEQPLDKQVGIYVIMFDPIDWRKGNSKKQDILEIFGSPELYKKVHDDIISSFVLDMAPMFVDERDPGPIEITDKNFNSVLEKLEKNDWQVTASFGKEKREEISKDEIYAESISVEDNIVHLMCSIN